MEASRSSIRKTLEFGRSLSRRVPRLWGKFILLTKKAWETLKKDEGSPHNVPDAPVELTLSSIPGASSLSENLRDLLEGRFEDIRDSSENTIEYAGLVVDLLDEVALILPSAAHSDDKALTTLQSILKDALQHVGGELLFFDAWTPEYQRAVEVDRCLPKDSPTVMYAHKAYGFKINGRLIRKQEVSIQAPIL